MSGKFKSVSGAVGNRIKPSEDKSINTEIKHPVFCFKYLHRKYDLSHCEVKEKVALLDTLHFLSQKTWSEIHLAHRHSFGTEKIKQTSIKGAGIPTHLSKDEVLYALRFDKLKPMVGYKSSFVFHILYLDRDFSLYDH